MSLTGALNNAVSGLTATARSAGIVSSNIANALTEGYGRRELLMSSDTGSTYGGVQVDGVLRHVDPVVLADRRLADAKLAHSDAGLSAASRLEALFGEFGTPGSLSDSINRFETALIQASADPSSTLRLTSVANSADELARTFNRIGAGIQAERMRADDRISRHVDTLNTNLEKIAEVNARISTALNVGRDPSALLDQRQVLIDAVSEIVPVRVVPRDRGAVAIYTTGGTILLDGRPAEVGFQGAGIIVPEMTLGNGLLAGLTVNGRPLRSDQFGPMSGGRLGADLLVRDDLSVKAQAALDAVALDLVQRFETGGPDPTVGTGMPGLFTGEGLSLTPTSEIGLSSRIGLNGMVSPVGGDIRLLRDGLYTTAPGEVGDSTVLNRMQDALARVVPATSDALSRTSRSIAQHAAAISSEQSLSRMGFEQDKSFASAQHLALRDLELSLGVDTDLELQSLMDIEQIYQANARVITVIDDLMQTVINM